MAGVYNVTSTVNSCTSPSSATIVSFNTSPSAPTAGNNGPVCEGSSLSLTASTVSGCTYSWSGPNAYTSIIQNPTVSSSVTSAMAGYYKVKAISISNGCASSLDSTSVTVIPKPNAKAGDDTTICPGSSIILKASGGSSYTWNNGVTQGIAFIPTSTKTYTVTVSNGFCIATDSIKVTIATLPSTPVIYLVGSVLNSTASIGNQWYFNNTIITGATSQTYTPASTGNYSCIVTDALGCSSGASNAIYIAFTGLTNFSGTKDVYIYPNPVSDKLYIEASPKSLIEISNIQGQLLETQVANTNKISIDVSAFPSGVYIIAVRNEKEMAIEKFIKE
jgi:hypothetical protein